ncbi:hypothetical protein DL765_004214 [Monosporascus sp. GIB2]|nr:hypothetical protein DL765_004214 [Monosporascus sp. GIB2]
MGPGSSATVPTPRRQSCDRCHRKKQRCTRPDNRNTGACDRCIRKGVLCAYSSSLPKGRPSLYRLSEAPAGPGPPARPPSTSSPSAVPDATPDYSPDSPNTTSVSGLPTIALTPVQPDQLFGDTLVDVHVDLDLHGDTSVLPGPLDSFAWCQNNQFSDGMLGIVPSSASTFNLDPVQEAQTLANLKLSGSLHGGCFGGNATRNCTGPGQGHARDDGLGPEKDSAEDRAEDSSVASSSRGGRVVPSADKSGSDLSIRHLSWLSTWLSRLLGSSRHFLADSLDSSEKDANPERQVQLGIEAVFKSINTWLVHGSVDSNATTITPSRQAEMCPANSRDLLHHVFSATNHLLNILRHVRAAAGPNPLPCPQGANLAVQHLVFVCATLLLNMYVVILTAFQRSANMLKTHHTRANTDHGRLQLAEPDRLSIDATERVHVQLFTVVQLCSYFIHRQSQTLEMLIQTGQGADKSEPRGSSDAVGELKTEVEQRLRRLQECLYIDQPLTTHDNVAMSSLVPDAAVITEAEQLVSSLKAHRGSAADQAAAVRQLDKLRCLLHSGPDALQFQALPFQILPALNMMSNFGVFDAVPLGRSISIEDLAAAVQLDAGILSRFLRLVLTQAIFKEKAPGVYEHTTASAIFRTDQAASFYRLGTTQFPHWWRVSDYLKTHSAQESQDATKVPYVWAQGKEGLTYYEAIEADPAASDAWHKGMMLIESTQPITGMFPFAAMRDAVQAEPHRAFVVDVGGGRGNALAAIMRECGGSSYGARMILQDLSEVLEGQDPVRVDGVQNMPHDFFDVQPVQQAHIYYLRNVLHNHYDDRSRRILGRIVDAMGPTSRVLLGEMILPATAAPGSDPYPFFMDLNMFMEGGIERSEKHWRELLGSVGLEIEHIWRLPDNPVQSTIEARLKRD